LSEESIADDSMSKVMVGAGEAIAGALVLSNAEPR